MIKPPASKPAKGRKPTEDAGDTKPAATPAKPGTVEEVGGRDGPDPTRYGDWEFKGRCIDF